MGKKKKAGAPAFDDVHIVPPMPTNCAVTIIVMSTDGEHYGAVAQEENIGTEFKAILQDCAFVIVDRAGEPTGKGVWWDLHSGWVTGDVEVEDD